jgi:uncharacterized protein with NRDE domain
VCTLILGIEVLGPRTVLLAANRDEDPARPADPPLVLRGSPLVAGGRDRQAGGTWLALRGRCAAVAMLNRRPRGASRPEPGPADPAALSTTAPPRALRSRGLLAIDAAAAEAGANEVPRAILAKAEALTGVDSGLPGGMAYAPFSLVVASPAGCWLMTNDGETPLHTRPIGPGWRVLTHEELDDPREPRSAWLVRELAGWAPASRAAAEARLTALLKLHADEAAPGAPAVCIHEGRMRTVSSALVWLAPGEAAYSHAEGPPCRATFVDYTRLLAGGPDAI